MILASAGSGKTYALTNRFVRLLALGAKPERIVALTFTRKAAGEFFDEILVKLARASRDPDGARRLAAQIGQPQLKAGDFRTLLRSVIEAMPRLRLGTFDGFFSRIARSFPFELGLTGQFEILQEHSASLERTRVLKRMFEHTRAVQPAQREFIEAFKRATFGTDEKRLQTQLDAFLDRHQEVFLNANDEAAWGNRSRIWPQGAEWEKAASRRTVAQNALEEAVTRMNLSDPQRERWRAFFDELNEWSPGAVLGDALEYLLKNALKALPDLREIVIERKKVTLDAEASRSLRELLYAIIELEVMRRLEMTRGIRDVLSSYDRIYHDAVRRAGKLTFGDIQRLLQPRDDAPVWSDDDGESGRHLLDYRLDGEIDHWLLDEFQDTSFGQWSVLRNLVDEVVQDPSGARSFFYVGDVKQAIFSWRDGDPRLFREIFNRYNAIQSGTIAEEHLVESWRSGPAIIETVNRVFGDAAVLREMFPGPAAETWNHEWRDHRSAKPRLAGQAALLHARDEGERFNVALAVLQEVVPLERGLTCALLVQDNATGARLADFLRREGGLPAVAESDLHVCTDNPLGAALLALVKAAAHPGDSLAQKHLRMTPLDRIFEAEHLESPDRLSLFVLEQIHARGFESAITSWVRQLEPVWAPDDQFTRDRARQFITAAGEFDATGSRDVAEFIAFMERYTVRDVEISGALRVMTIHKSKGLGFDVVILADLEGNRLDSRRSGLAVEKNADRRVEWVLDLPEKLFHAHDSVLAAHVRRAEADACYESLSLLYVAMTRAKQGLYIITKPPGNSVSRNFAKLLGATLGADTVAVSLGGREVAGAFSAGDPRWFEQTSALEPVDVPPAESIALAVAPLNASRRLLSRRATDEKTRVFKGESLFSPHRASAVDFGNALHALLATVEWWEPARASEVIEMWRRRGVEERAIEAAWRCLQAPALRSVWSKSENTELWRERAFEIVIEGAWITGVFDRVQVHRDGSGKLQSVEIFDFKTEAVEPGDDLEARASAHAGQLRVYSRAAALLVGGQPEQVRAFVVFTGVQRAIPLRFPTRSA